MKLYYTFVLEFRKRSIPSLEFSAFYYDYNLGKFFQHDMGYAYENSINLDFLLSNLEGFGTNYYVEGNMTTVSGSQNLITVQPANSTSVPEPSSLLSLVTLGAMITTFKSKKKQEV